MKRPAGLLTSVALIVLASAAGAQECTYAEPAALNEGAQAELSTIVNDVDGITIAYLPMGTEFNYHIALGEGIADIAETRDDVDWFTLSPYSGSDLAGQMGMLQDVTSRPDVDAIILISFDESALAPLVEEAVNAGKAVIIINSDIPDFPTPVHGVVGVNQRAVNHALADWAIEQAGGDARNVGILDGEPGYLATERAGGFVDGIEGTNWEIVSRINGGWSVERGNTAAMDLMQAHPDVDVIYASNDYMALGAVLAARALGRNDLTILGYDGDTGALEDIAAGGMTATSDTAPVIMGRTAACFVLSLLDGDTEGGYVNTQTRIVHAGNAVEVLQAPEDLFPAPSREY
ncbi:sugar ABC transporter substrate-binding protein [Gymnodinialimonas hymeniacidonis]|uniref:sugar ABC transporter substrate-binding protein n=1 Tax=Gymnodinialimonas hymeniacidonis TaxID=3126508 RepID=UPI0034C69B89